MLNKLIVKPTHKRRDLTPDEISEEIKERAEKFELQMISGEYHTQGGCSIPVINDAQDCMGC